MNLAVVAAVTLTSIMAVNSDMAQTTSEKCAAYARQATSQTPATTGAARGAARGAVGGAIVGGDAGRGAAAGAVVGGTRKAVQKSRSYQSYYDECMKR